jgi:hypothetical protein
MNLAPAVPAKSTKSVVSNRAFMNNRASMKNIFLSTLALLLLMPSQAQVAKKVVVEHFTNTICSNCASRNPGFFTNLDNHPEVLHLAIHPSSPYSSCLLNQHNVVENDGRTNYYSIYGGTPRLVVQGNVIGAGTNYGSASIFSPHTGTTSPASIRVAQSKFGSDSLRVTVSVKAESEHSLGALRLLVALAEDTIFYNAPNGETEHYNVFRKSLSGFEGQQIYLPLVVGDSVQFTASTPMSQDWDPERIFTMVILQEETSKEVVQAEAVSPALNSSTPIEDEFQLSFRVFPNPARETLQIESEAKGPLQGQLFSLLGRQISQFTFQNQFSLDVRDLNSGVYWLRFRDEDGRTTGRKFVKE